LSSSFKSDIYRSYLVKGAKLAGVMEFPCLSQINEVPNSLSEFKRLKKPDAENQYIHFYMSDEKFKCVYNNPQNYLQLFKGFAGIIGFDFSVHTECPLCKQIENYNKNRELSYWFASQGINVIPNVRWGKKVTFDWCFDGLPKRSTIAVSTLGCFKTKDDKRLFMNGFQVMLERLLPKVIVVYGTKNYRLFPDLQMYISDSTPVFFESQITIAHRKEVVEYGYGIR